MSVINTFAVNPIGIFSFLQKNIASAYEPITFSSNITYTIYKDVEEFSKFSKLSEFCNGPLSLNCTYSLESPTFLETELFKINNKGMTRDGKIHLILEIKICEPDRILLYNKPFTLELMNIAKPFIIDKLKKLVEKNPIFYFNENEIIDENVYPQTITLSGGGKNTNKTLKLEKNKTTTKTKVKLAKTNK
jgi:hypothetical protein